MLTQLLAMIVTMGNEAAYAFVEDWPTLKNMGGIKNASSIEERRGYVWGDEKTPTRGGYKVFAAGHPAAADRTWVPWRMLLAYDFKEAKREFGWHGSRIVRPKREVIVVT